MKSKFHFTVILSDTRCISMSIRFDGCSHEVSILIGLSYGKAFLHGLLLVLMKELVAPPQEPGDHVPAPFRNLARAIQLTS